MEEVREHVVLAEDNEVLRKLLQRLFQQEGIPLVAEERGDEAMKRVNASTLAVLVDLNMPGWDGFQCLEWLAREHPGLPAVVLTAMDSAADAVKAMKLGAIDYLTKPFDAGELFIVMRNAMEMRRLRNENDALKQEIIMPQAHTAAEPVAESTLMRTVLTRARKAAPLDSNILITGESGTGKGVLARYIHSMSPRSAHPFVTVSCPALPRELLESELFGHEKGAFTGALKRRLGKIDLARGGTLFLDEIGDLPMDLQPKLLNVLQDREYQRVGGEQTLKTDVRIIAATNVPLVRAVKEGCFREDLFYRLSVLTLENPPLRERPEDVAALIDHSLHSIAARRSLAPYRLSSAAKNVLLAYSWPGNVRQLENLIEQATAFCDKGLVELSDLPAELSGSSREDESGIAGLGGRSLDAIERDALRQTLVLHKGNRVDTAKSLGISEKSVYNLMRRHGVRDL
jgi:DNA-binding NtrC family response regulator